MPEKPQRPKPDLELVDTDDLVDELRRRSKVFFLVARPLGEQDYDWRRHWGVDGGAPRGEEALARVLGLVQIAVANLLNDRERPDPE